MATSNFSHQIPLFKVFLPPRQELLPQLEDILYSGQISEGQPVVDFEFKFSEFINCPSVLSFSSGTAALHTALVLSGVKPGDEVISTAMTAEPSNMAILHAQANIVWADVDPQNGNISADSIASRITSKTKAIQVVHYGGIPASMHSIRQVASTHGIPVIEDAAHAFGARYSGQPIGLHSEFVMFSLQAIKHMTTIDGGILSFNFTKDDHDLLSRARRFRWFGIDRQIDRTKVDVRDVGYKYHMNNVTATIGLLQLKHISRIVQRHIDNGQYFDRNLSSIPGLSLCTWDSCAEPSYWFYTVLVEDRDNFSALLTSHGIANSQVHRRNDLHSLFSSSKCELPGLDTFYDKMIHIPCGWWVTDEQRAYIVSVIKKGW